MKRTVPICSPCTSLGDGSDGDPFERGRLVDPGYMSDREYVFEEGNQSASTSTDSDPGSDEEERQDQHQHTGKHVYSSACARLGIAPASHILSRLSSDRLSLRHAILNPASAAALSAGLSFNRCLRSLNLSSNLLGDDSARVLLEAISGNPSLTKLDLSRNLLSDRFGKILAQSLSSPLCSLRDLVLADNFLSDCFTDALSEGMRNLRTVSVSLLRNLDVSNNKICDRNGETLASILCRSSVCSLNLSWNDLRESEHSKKRRAGRTFGFPLAGAALVHPGRLVSLELSFNGLIDAFGVIVGGMLAGNASLSVLDLSRNRLGKSSALSIAGGLKSNRGLRTIKLGWNGLGREGTLGIIRAIGDNQGPLQVVRMENTTDAGLEFEATREAELAVAARAQWVEVVCEYPDRARTKGNSHAGPVSWMTEHAPDAESNTAYKTRQEQEHDQRFDRMGPFTPTAPRKTSPTPGGGRTKATTRTTAGVAAGAAPPRTNLRAPPPIVPAPSSKSPRTCHFGKSRGATAVVSEEQEQSLRPSVFGPAKEAVAVPVLSVRLKLRAREEARLEAERLAAWEIAVAEEEGKKQPATLSYLKPLDKRAREKTLAEPPPRLLMLRKAKTKADSYNATKRRGGAKGGRIASRGRTSTPRGLVSSNSNRVGRGHSRSSRSVPRYMQQITSRSAQESIQSTSQHALGRLQNGGSGLWGPGKSTDQRPKADGKSGQRRSVRGRSSTAGRSRGSATKSWLRHVSKSRPSSGRSRGRNARRTNKSSSPSRSTWPAMRTIIQVVAPPSRLKLRGNHQE